MKIIPYVMVAEVVMMFYIIAFGPLHLGARGHRP